MNLILENANLKDIPALNEISLKSKSYWGYPEDWLNSWEEDLTIGTDHINKHQTYKLLLEGEIVGFCVIQENNKEFQITHFWVIPRYIGWGFGKFLMEESLKKGINSPCKVKVESDPNAEGFYQKFGFKTVSQVESYPKGRYLPVMEMVLN